jgi:hypothetical protein
VAIDIKDGPVAERIDRVIERIPFLSAKNIGD